MTRIEQAVGAVDRATENLAEAMNCAGFYILVPIARNLNRDLCWHVHRATYLFVCEVVSRSLERPVRAAVKFSVGSCDRW